MEWHFVKCQGDHDAGKQFNSLRRYSQEMKSEQKTVANLVTVRDLKCIIVCISSHFLYDRYLLSSSRSGPPGNTKKESIASASVWGAGQQLLAQFVLRRGLGLCPTGGLTVRRVDAWVLVPAEARGSPRRDMYFPCCVWAQGMSKVCS